MGGSITTPVHIEYFSDRGGDYTITRTDDKWTFRWGTVQKGVEVDVFQQEHLCAGHLVRNNLSKKATKHFDDDLAAFERDEETCSNQQPILSQSEGRVKKRQFKPLPMAAYKPSKVAFEQNVPSAKDEFKPLPKVFGMGPTVEAKVILDLFF